MSDANRTAVRYTREQSFGVVYPALTAENVTGSCALHAARFTKDSFEHAKETVQSDEVRSDRMVADLVRVGVNALGSMETEMPMGDLDELIAAALQQDWQQVASCFGTIGTDQVVAANGNFAGLRFAKFLKITASGAPISAADNNIVPAVSVDATASTLNLAPGSIVIAFFDEPVLVYRQAFGDSLVRGTTIAVGGGNTVYTLTSGSFSAVIQAARYIRIAGAPAANNGVRKIVSCTSTVLTVASVGTESTSGAITVTYDVDYVRTGTTMATFVIQKEFLDIGRYLAFTGCAIDTWEMKVTARAKASHTFSFTGLRGLSRTNPIHSTSIAASTNPIVTGVNVGSITRNGSAFANAVRSISLRVANNLRYRPQIGSLFTQEQGSGQSTITGQIEAYFANKELLEDFINHVPFALEFTIADSAGRTMAVYLPRIQSTKGTPMGQGVNSDVMQNLDFQATPDPTLGYQIQIDRP